MLPITATILKLFKTAYRLNRWFLTDYRFVCYYKMGKSGETVIHRYIFLNTLYMKKISTGGERSRLRNISV